MTTTTDQSDPRGASFPDIAPVPHRIHELGIPPSMLDDLILRRALLDGHTSTLRLAERLAVPPMLMEEALEGLRHRRLFDVDGMEGRNWLLRLTDQGHVQASERLEMCRYAGPTPVGLAAYTEVVESQRASPDVDRARLRAAFTDLVVADELLDELGPAIGAKGAIFLYGPPGTGKSALAERLTRVQQDHVLVPHAVEVDSQVVIVFDPVMHRPVEPQPPGVDARWVVCTRPSILAGGELTANELNLTFEPTSGLYVAPLQMQANGGILVIDDFGRQLLTPDQLLNRWIVPLDRGIDYLTLEYGVKFRVPFTPKVVFSTNLEPSALGDEAFFRRIRSKVFIPPMDDAQFDEVLRRVGLARGVEITADAPAHLRSVSRREGDGDLRPYLPGAVCELVQSICAYEGTPMVLDPAMIDRIAHLYFTRGLHGFTDQDSSPDGE